MSYLRMLALMPIIALKQNFCPDIGWSIEMSKFGQCKAINELLNWETVAG
jgi:hypothetical protein